MTVLHKYGVVWFLHQHNEAATLEGACTMKIGFAQTSFALLAAVGIAVAGIAEEVAVSTQPVQYEQVTGTAQTPAELELNFPAPEPVTPVTPVDVAAVPAPEVVAPVVQDEVQSAPVAAAPVPEVEETTVSESVVEEPVAEEPAPVAPVNAMPAPVPPPVALQVGPPAEQVVVANPLNGPVVTP